MNGSPMPYFTEGGYAVWDDIREEIYVDPEGVSEEFTSEWQAEDYLLQVKEDVARQEVETAAVLRHIEIQPHEARVLDGERRLFDGLAALHIGGLFVVVVTSVPIRRVPQEGVPDDRVIPLIDVCRGRGKTVSGSRERDGAELGVILLKGGIPLFMPPRSGSS